MKDKCSDIDLTPVLRVAITLSLLDNSNYMSFMAKEYFLKNVTDWFQEQIRE